MNIGLHAMHARRYGVARTKARQTSSAGIRGTRTWWIRLNDGQTSGRNFFRAAPDFARNASVLRVGSAVRAADRMHQPSSFSINSS
jgi:hypothetical protein